MSKDSTTSVPMADISGVHWTVYVRLAEKERRRQIEELRAKEAEARVARGITVDEIITGFIEDLGKINYPDGICSPHAALNTNNTRWKFRYDIEFLLQFMNICKDKPQSLPPFASLGLDPLELVPNSIFCGGRRQSLGPGVKGITRTKPLKDDGIAIGCFGVSNSGSPAHSAGVHYERIPGNQFSTSGRGLPQFGRSRTKRGERRSWANKPHAESTLPSSPAAVTSITHATEPVTPLKADVNRWTTFSVGGGAQLDNNSSEVVVRKVRALLNKLSAKNSDSILGQIISWTNKSETLADSRALVDITGIIYQKAMVEPRLSQVYASLCQEIQIHISPKIQDNAIRNASGKPITGGHLFRKYLLNQLQEDFERGWVSTTAAIKGVSGTGSDLYREGNDTGAKSRYLSLIKFMSELFKLQMVTERIMHNCVSYLLENPTSGKPDIESLSKLLTVIGHILDTPKARNHINVYFAKLKVIEGDATITPRLRFMTQDLIELRERKWKPRIDPTQIPPVQKIDEKQKYVARKDRQHQYGPNPSRQNNRGDSPPRPGDLSTFGKINRTKPLTFGPSSTFATKKSQNVNSSIHFPMFSRLIPNGASPLNPPEPRSMPDTQIHTGSAPTPPTRKKLNLLPRTKPEVSSQVSGSKTHHASALAPMTELEVAKQVQEDVMELFAIRNLDEAELYFSKLPDAYRHRLVDKLVTRAIEGKESDSRLVADLFARVAEKKLCSPALFEEGFMPTAEMIDDIAIDVPLAYLLFAKMLRGAGLHADKDRLRQIVSKSKDGEKLLAMCK